MTEALSAISTAAATTTAPRLLVIDATAGNGSDSAHLASLVCAAPYPLDLLCIDVQPSSIAKTEKRLRQFDGKVNYEVELRSHHPLLPVPRPVALAVYNLGYLPNDGNKASDVSRVQTATSSSLQSMTAAISLLVERGTVVVTSYPASNQEEHEAVVALSTAVGRLSSRETWSYWRENSPDCSEELKGLVDGLDTRGRAYRVFGTEARGRMGGPMLTTVTRIK